MIRAAPAAQQVRLRLPRLLYDRLHHFLARRGSV